MEKTIPDSNLNKRRIGYVVNSTFSPENQESILRLQQRLATKFGNGLWLPLPGSLHITLMDWLAPLVDYDRPKDETFPDIYDEYDRALTEATKGMGPIEVRFGTIGASHNAIFIQGEDSGQYQEIRKKFLGKVSLLPNTKLPPTLIHSTIARFIRPLNLAAVREYTGQQQIKFDHITNAFRLIRTTDTKMEDFKVIKSYELD
jgi:hypothetical protein